MDNKDTQKHLIKYSLVLCEIEFQVESNVSELSAFDLLKILQYDKPRPNILEVMKPEQVKLIHFQQYDDACVQQRHFVHECVDKKFCE